MCAFHFEDTLLLRTDNQYDEEKSMFNGCGQKSVPCEM